jgi:predicted type IV restriction endonuclease
MKLTQWQLFKTCSLMFLASKNIHDMLAEVFGFEKFVEITAEYEIRGKYCDLAIKMDDKIQYLIEVKAIGTTLKINHIKQVVNYGVNKGVQWVVLTNGIIWQLYKIKFQRPIERDLVSTLNFLEVNPRKKKDQEKLFLLSKRGLGKSIREEYYERVKNVNRFVVSAIVLSENVINLIKRDIRKLSSGLKVESDEIEKILRNEVIKRDVMEDEETLKAINKVKRINKKVIKHGKKMEKKQVKLPEALKPTESE